jgi:hypothetical protein
MPKNPAKTFSVYLDEDYQNILRASAKNSEMSIAQYIRHLVDKYAKADSGTTKIILNIPQDVLYSSEDLDNWLTVKKNAIVNHFKNGSH